MQQRLSELQVLVEDADFTANNAAEDLRFHIARQDQKMVEHATITWQIREEMKGNHVRSFNGLSSQLIGLKGLSDEVAKERELVQSLFIKLKTLRSEPSGPPLTLVSEFQQVSQRIHSRFTQLSGFIRNAAGDFRLRLDQI